MSISILFSISSFARKQVQLQHVLRKWFVMSAEQLILISWLFDESNKESKLSLWSVEYRQTFLQMHSLWTNLSFFSPSILLGLNKCISLPFPWSNSHCQCISYVILFVHVKCMYIRTVKVIVVLFFIGTGIFINTSGLHKLSDIIQVNN